MSNDDAPSVQRRGLMLVLSSPSGAGKTTLSRQLLGNDSQISLSISCTTRDKRPGEKDGVDYRFIDTATFRGMIDRGEFLEHATVYTNRYGTLKSEVLGRLREGRDVLLTVDVQGAASIQAEARRDPEMAAALVTVFLTPQTLSELERRLQKRNQNTPADAAKRLGEARREIARWGEFEYLIISTSIAEDVRRMLAIVDAEKMRASRSAAPEL